MAGPCDQGLSSDLGRSRQMAPLSQCLDNRGLAVLAAPWASLSSLRCHRIPPPTPSCPLLPGPAQGGSQQGFSGRRRLGLWPWQPPAKRWGLLAVPGMAGDQR